MKGMRITNYKNKVMMVIFENQWHKWVDELRRGERHKGQNPEVFSG